MSGLECHYGCDLCRVLNQMDADAGEAARPVPAVDEDRERLIALIRAALKGARGLALDHDETALDLELSNALDALGRVAGVSPSTGDDRLTMYQEMYVTVAAKWAAVLDAADKAEDVQPDEVIEALRGQPARRCTKVYFHEHDETCRWVSPSTGDEP